MLLLILLIDNIYSINPQLYFKILIWSAYFRGLFSPILLHVNAYFLKGKNGLQLLSNIKEIQFFLQIFNSLNFAISCINPPG